MSDGTSIYSMIAGIGDSFGKSYTSARNRALEDEAPALFGQLLGIGGAAAAPAPTMGTLGEASPAAAPAIAKAPTFAATGGAMGDYLGTTRAKESGGNDLAANPNSTAKGRYQFTDGTWADVAKRHPGLGLTPGGWKDPEQQERAMQAFTADNAKALTAAGIPINPGNLYVSHFLGEAGGPKFIAGAMSNPDAPAVAFVSPRAARANRNIFFEKDGRPKTAGAVYAERTSRYAGSGPVPTPTLPGAPAPVAVANSEAETQALESRMGMMPIPGPPALAEADLPAADAQPAQFRIPGQPAPAAAPQGFAGFGSSTSRMSPDQAAVLQAAWKNPVTRPMATEIYSSLLKSQNSAWKLQQMGDQPVLFNERTAQIVPVGQGKRQTATVGNVVVDLATGQPIYEGERDPKTTTVGNTIVDTRTGQPIYTAPEKPQTVAPGSTLVTPDGRVIFQSPTKDDKDEGAKITAQVAARKQEAAGLGLIEGTPAWQSYVGTGKIGRDQDLSATDKKAIQEADEGVLSAQTAIDALKQAKQLSTQAYEGPTAGLRGSVSSMFGSEGGVATQDLANVVTTNALGQLKAIFGGNPTEGERKIMLEIQGSVNQPDVVRQKIFDRGLALAQKRLDFNQKRAEDLRGGTYYKQDGAPGASKGPTIPKGDARMAIPDGKSAAAALAEAQAVARSRPDLKPQLQERLRTWGIDPKRLDD